MMIYNCISKYTVVLVGESHACLQCRVFLQYRCTGTGVISIVHGFGAGKENGGNDVQRDKKVVQFTIIHP